MLTKETTGLTKESCSKIDNTLSNNTVSVSSISDANEDSINQFIKSTSQSRKEERTAVNTYIETRREIAREKYNEKSQTLIDNLDLNTQEITFKSNYAPLILTNMTADEIKEASNNSAIEIIGYYDTPEYEIDSMESIITDTGIDKINSGTSLDLTGDGVKVGIIDQTGITLYPTTENGIVPDNETPTVRNGPDGTTMTDYGNVVFVGDTVPHFEKSHARDIAEIILSIAPDTIIYSSENTYACIEAMIAEGVQILNMSLGSPVLETDDNYAYTVKEKWVDHIIANHNVTFLKSAGNKGGNDTDYTYFDSNGNEIQGYGARVTSPGMAYNAITVGAYDDELNTLSSYSSYKNSAGGKNGCEKPDVVLPSSIKDTIGTSFSTPVLTGTIALMFELKPSLSNYPHVTKAIVLASCHRKIDQTALTDEPETMEQGITERQGAGAPDAWTMACIVSQGTYGSGILTGTSQKINIIQPQYGASKMNVSLTWIKENIAGDDHTNVSDITIVGESNLNLNVYQNDESIASSALTYSSTEMCYFDISESINKYQLLLTQSLTPTYTRYAYAWSTNETYFTNITNDGIYYLRNKGADKTLYCNTSDAVVIRTIKKQSNLGTQFQWILKSDGAGNYNLLTGNEDVSGGLSSTTDTATLASQPSSLQLIQNEDGTVSFVSNGKILSYSSSSAVWDTYSGEILSKQKWYLEKNNYRIGDVDMNGVLNINDATTLHQYSLKIITFNSLQVSLSDVNNDGRINILDVTAIQKILNS